MPSFPSPLPTSKRNVVSLAGAYNAVTDYLDGLINLSSGAAVYNIFIDGSTYLARRGDVDDVVDSDSDVGALLNRLFAGGNAHAHLQTQGTYFAQTTIVPETNCILSGQGPLTVIKAQTDLGSSTAYLIDWYDGGVGRKWVQVLDVWFDCNDLVYGGMHMLGVQGDVSAMTMVFRNSIANHLRVGMRVDDFDSKGGTRQFFWANKIGPGASGEPTVGIEMHCNDIHLWKNDVFLQSDVGVHIGNRGSLFTSVGTWWLLDNHIQCSTFVAGGISPDDQPVNIFIDAATSSGNIQDNYIDNIHRYGVVIKPSAGNTASAIRITDNHFNGNNLVDDAPDDAGVGILLDATDGGPSSIYSIKIVGNVGQARHSKARPTGARWVSIVALRGGIPTGTNYVELDHNHFKSAMAYWDPDGTRPDHVGGGNFIQPAINNTSEGTFTESHGHWTSLDNLLQNPTLQEDVDANSFPDDWIKTGALAVSYPGGNVLQLFHPSGGQILYQDVPVVAGRHYSVSGTAEVTVDANNAEAARLSIAFLDEFGVLLNIFSTTGATGVGAPALISNNNRTALVDDLTTHGTGGMAFNGSTLTAATGTFASSAAVVGLEVIVEGAGSADGSEDLITTISGWTSTTVVTLASPCLNTGGVSGAPWVLRAAGTVSGSSATTSLVSATGLFTSMVVGQQVIIRGANTDGSDFATTVASFTNSTHVTLVGSIPVVTAGAEWLFPTLNWGHGDAVVARIELKTNNASHDVTIQWADDLVFAEGTTTAGQPSPGTTWAIPHGLGVVPSSVILTPANGAAATAQADSGWAIALDDTNINLTTPSVSFPEWFYEVGA